MFLLIESRSHVTNFSNKSDEKDYTFFLHTGNMIFIRNDIMASSVIDIGYIEPIENFRRNWL